MKRAVKVAYRMADRRWGLRNDFKGNKKIFLKKLKEVRKGEQARNEMVKDANGQILRYGVEVRNRWAENFGQVLNVGDVGEANIDVVGNRRMPVLEDLIEKAITFVEVGEAVEEMKSGKAPELN